MQIRKALTLISSISSSELGTWRGIKAAGPDRRCGELNCTIFENMSFFPSQTLLIALSQAAQYWNWDYYIHTYDSNQNGN